MSQTNRAFTPYGKPMLAATASVTVAIHDEIVKILDMRGAVLSQCLPILLRVADVIHNCMRKTDPTKKFSTGYVVQKLSVRIV